ncbi:metal transporter [Sinorhizobium americanum]|uniref:Metal cation transporter n=1 Tax=Sinorhizobium americanum TaxID=194963 RepID=A0A1L3LVG2_9HYPH|nr:metal transporter [Sinorhizobium americanum]APG94085.1 metal cation transporter [Sinorhizobium americanum]
MNERVVVDHDIPVAERRARRAGLLWLLAPLAVLAAALWGLVAADPLAGFNNGAPPVENLTVERTVLDQDGLRLLVRGGGSEAMNIAQVQVDAAYWQFEQTPPGPIARGSTAWISVPFPWVLGEAHKVTLVTNTGATFEHEIPVAVPTPVATSATLSSQALLGAFVGILPVAIGLMFYPALRGAGPWMMRFLLAMTVGLLGFLFIDTLEEALEFAGQSAAIFQGSAMVFLAAAAAFLLLMAISRREGRPSGLALATYIALGIGLHNLGEGLAIGAAFAAGAAGLGAFLVMGFTLHNITEGIAIAAPILKARPLLWRFAALALLAGGPAVLGMWLGSLAYAPHWAALALAIGAGAILQVIVEVSASMIRTHEGRLSGLLTTPVMSGIAVGVAFMYATAMLVKI